MGATMPAAFLPRASSSFLAGVQRAASPLPGCGVSPHSPPSRKEPVLSLSKERGQGDGSLVAHDLHLTHASGSSGGVDAHLQALLCP